jgi:hypothetical protein
MRNAADVAGGKPIAVLLQSITGVSAINPLVAFYDIHGGKREVLFFYFFIYFISLVWCPGQNKKYTVMIMIYLIISLYKINIIYLCVMNIGCCV